MIVPLVINRSIVIKIVVWQSPSKDLISVLIVIIVRGLIDVAYLLSEGLTLVRTEVKLTRTTCHGLVYDRILTHPNNILKFIGEVVRVKVS